MTEFYVGELATVHSGSPAFWKFEGELVEITGALGWYEAIDDTGRPGRGYGYAARMLCNNKPLFVRPENLRHLDDGRTVGSWAECAWQPQEIPNKR